MLCEYKKTKRELGFTASFYPVWPTAINVVTFIVTAWMDSFNRNLKGDDTDENYFSGIHRGKWKTYLCQGLW